MHSALFVFGSPDGTKVLFCADQVRIRSAGVYKLLRLRSLRNLRKYIVGSAALCWFGTRLNWHAQS